MNERSKQYRVELAGQGDSHLRKLVVVAEQRNLVPVLLEVMSQVIENLEKNPREWGDPYNNYPALGAVGYGKTILSAGLRIGYAVHDTERIVWITSFRPLFGSPFT